MPDSIDKDTLAKWCGETLFRSDKASAALGIRIVEITPGHATTVMQVRDDMVNGFDICHGGMIFSLADSTFALAGNSHNILAVAMSCHIDFLRPAFKGDTLTARASELARTRSGGSYSICVNNQDGKTIAIFSGRSSNRGKPVISDTALEGLLKNHE